MTALTRFVISLYPQSWRERYGAEFEALIEDMPSNLANTLDILKGALRMRLSAWSPIRVVLIAAVLGAIGGVLACVLLSRGYASEISIGVSRASIGTQTRSQHVGHYVEKVIDTAFNKASLETAVQTLELTGKRGLNLPRAGAQFKRSITVSRLEESNGMSRFVVRFQCRDPKVAREVDEKLVGMIMDQALQLALTAKSAPPLTFMVLGTPTLLRSGLLHIWIFSVAGAAVGTVLALLARVTSRNLKLG